MDEQKETQEAKTSDTAENTGERDKPESTTLLDKANATAERLERTLEKLEIENRKTEELLAKRALGGQTTAGSGVPEAKKEETPQEYAERIRKGEVNPLS